MRLSALLLPPLLLLACKGEDDDGETPVDSEPTGEDSAADDSDSTDDSAEPDDPCAAAGLTVRPFQAGGKGLDFHTLAPDFTFNTTAGAFTFSERFTGCDSYVFINYYEPNKYPVNFNSSSKIAELLETSPPNVHYFLLSYSQDAATISDEMAVLSAGFQKARDSLDESLSAHWADRVHFVLDSAWEADWIGALNQSYYVDGEFVLWSASIDRFQQVRENGYFCDPATGWEQCPPIFLLYEPEYFNFESDRADTMDAETDVTVIPAFDDELLSDGGWAGVRGVAEITLPDAATMRGFDTLELDLTLDCAAYPSGTQCPAWDYLVYAYLCEADDLSTEADESQTCDVELGRWITTYWRPGRWVHDVSPFLAMMQEGGPRKIAFYTQQPYRVSLDLRLSNRGKGVRPVSMTKLWGGGTFNEGYNHQKHHSFDGSTWRSYIIEGEDDNFTVESYDPAAGALTLKAASSNEYRGGRYSRVFVSLSTDGLYLCWAENNATTLEDAEATPAADALDLAAGCEGGAWELLTTADGAEPASITGDWVELINASHAPMTVSVPADAARVELMTVVTGHGFGNTKEACAEFCDHQHRFTVNGDYEVTKEHPTAGTRWGCAEQVYTEGVIPNQSGTWVYGRAGWCPGLEVDLWTVDLTGVAKAGEESELAYTGLFDGRAMFEPQYNDGYGSTDAYILLTSYLVTYEADE
ncbi:MAG: hypothetical protein IPN01_33650 [Deltaproteobacteria bacterium]|nr:hypothetical protein [Deltaproteobacteria bacterium]